MVGPSKERTAPLGSGRRARPDRNRRSTSRARRSRGRGPTRRARGRTAVSARRPAANTSRRRSALMTTARLQLADELLRRLAAALRAGQLYSPGHPIIARNLDALSSAVQLLHGLAPSTVIGFVGNEVVVDDVPLANMDAMGPLIRKLQQSGVERITIARGVTPDELLKFLTAVMNLEPSQAAADSFPTLPHIRVGRVAIEQRVEGNLADIAEIKRLYNDA